MKMQKTSSKMQKIMKMQVCGKGKPKYHISSSVILLFIVPLLSDIKVAAVEQQKLFGPVTAATSDPRRPFGPGPLLDSLPVGGLADSKNPDIQGAFLMAVHELNANASYGSHQHLHTLFRTINRTDAFNIAKLFCNELEAGVLAMVGSVPSEGFSSLQSYANTFRLPLLIPLQPTKVPSTSYGLLDYVTAMLPEYHQAVLDVIHYYRWDHIIYIYQTQDGLQRLQHLYEAITSSYPKRKTFKIQQVRQVNSAKDALDIYRRLENRDRFSKKYILLDCSEELSKEIIIKHIQDFRLGRRTYHYLLPGLMFDVPWEDDIEEYGAVNITGFRLLNPLMPNVQDLLKRWSLLDAQSYPGAGKPVITAKAALVYDAVHVISEAVNTLQKRRPKMFNTSGRGPNPLQLKKTCDDTEESHDNNPFVETLARSIRKVKLEGVTGNISFTEDGKRQGFSLDVVEINIQRIAETIGRWSPWRGFTVVEHQNTKYRRPPNQPLQNKVYRVTTIVEKPFIMLKDDPLLVGNERFEGYAKDLADLVALTLGMNYTLKIVADGGYGMELPDGDWDGMVGELIRNEADIAIAPLTITSSREQIIYFTKPFMTFGISIMIKKPVKQKPGVFSFMSPLSEEIWMCVVFAYVGVATVLCLVSRFSPYEWKENNDGDKPELTNDFSMYNSLWFALSALMQQGVDLCPRSISGRIVGSVWWWFCLIIVSSYTANLAAFLTVDRMVTDIETVDQLSRQTEVEYGTREGGSTKQFFEKTKISIYARMWEFMNSRPHVFTDTYAEGIERVRMSKGKYALLVESVKNEYVNEQYPCDTMKIDQNLNSNGYGIATINESPIKEQLNLAILHLKEHGDLARLRNKWWFDKSECDDKTEPETAVNALSLNNVAGIFYILTGGLVLSMLSVWIEFCYRSKTDSQFTPLSFTGTMKAKARLSITGNDADYIRRLSFQPEIMPHF